MKFSSDTPVQICEMFVIGAVFLSVSYAAAVRNLSTIKPNYKSFEQQIPFMFTTQKKSTASSLESFFYHKADRLQWQRVQPILSEMLSPHGVEFEFGKIREAIIPVHALLATRGS